MSADAAYALDGALLAVSIVAGQTEVDDHPSPRVEDRVRGLLEESEPEDVMKAVSAR